MLWSYLRWVFAAESATAMCAPAAVRVHNDLAPGQSSVTNRTSQNKTAVHQVTAWHGSVWHSSYFGHQMELQQVALLPACQSRAAYSPLAPSAQPPMLLCQSCCPVPSQTVKGLCASNRVYVPQMKLI
jgi:hypothetical protein